MAIKNKKQTNLTRIEGAMALSMGTDTREPPTEFQIFSFGTTDTTKGKYSLDKESAEKLMATAKDYGNDFQIDYEHESVLKAGKAPAAGWFTPELRDDGIYATKVEWNEDAAQLLSQRKYRYFSPTFFIDGKGRVVELVNLALTNNPATKRMKPLIASRGDEGEQPKEDNTMDKLKMMLLGMLALSVDATDDQIMKAVGSLKDNARSTDHVIQLNALTGKASAGESLGYITALKQDAEAKDKKLVELTGKITDLEGKGREAEITRLVDDGIRDGKVAPAQKEMLLAQGRKDPEFLKGFLSTASKVVPDPKKEPGSDSKDAPITLTADQKKIAETLGLTEEQMKDSAKKMVVPASRA